MKIASLNLMKGYIIKDIQYKSIQQILLLTDSGFYIAQLLMQIGLSHKIIVAVLLFL